MTCTKCCGFRPIEVEMSVQFAVFFGVWVLISRRTSHMLSAIKQIFHFKSESRPWQLIFFLTLTSKLVGWTINRSSSADSLGGAERHHCQRYWLLPFFIFFFCLNECVCMYKFLFIIRFHLHCPAAQTVKICILHIVWMHFFVVVDIIIVAQSTFYALLASEINICMKYMAKSANPDLCS